MPEVVEPEVGHAGLPCPAVERPAHRVGVHRLACRPAEDQVALPCLADEQPAFVLSGPVATQDTHRLGVEVDRSPPVVGLRALREHQLALDHAQLPSDAELGGLEVDVGPQEPAHLAAAHPGLVEAATANARRIPPSLYSV